jgi:hypothetical protein
MGIVQVIDRYFAGRGSRWPASVRAPDDALRFIRTQAIGRLEKRSVAAEHDFILSKRPIKVVASMKSIARAPEAGRKPEGRRIESGRTEFAGDARRCGCNKPQSPEGRQRRTNFHASFPSKLAVRLHEKRSEHPEPELMARSFSGSVRITSAKASGSEPPGHLEKPHALAGVVSSKARRTPAVELGSVDNHRGRRGLICEAHRMHALCVPWRRWRQRRS